MDQKWFREEDGRPVGPFTTREISREIRRGRVGEHTRIFSTSQRVWIAAADVEELRAAIEATRPRATRHQPSAPPPPPAQPAPLAFTPVSAPASTSRTRDRPPPPSHRPALGRALAVVPSGQGVVPWRRFFARMLDLLLELMVSLLIVASLDAFSAFRVFGTTTEPFFAILFWYATAIGFHALLLSTFGTTLGKFCMGIWVYAADGFPPSFPAALNRTFLVVLLGLGLLPFNVITLLISFQRLVQRGSTYWDEKGQFRVRVDEIDPIRVVLGIVACGILTWAIGWQLGGLVPRS